MASGTNKKILLHTPMLKIYFSYISFIHLFIYTFISNFIILINNFSNNNENKHVLMIDKKPSLYLALFLPHA